MGSVAKVISLCDHKSGKTAMAFDLALRLALKGFPCHVGLATQTTLGTGKPRGPRSALRKPLGSIRHMVDPAAHSSSWTRSPEFGTDELTSLPAA
jgi:hypothetical protein